MFRRSGAMGPVRDSGLAGDNLSSGWTKPGQNPDEPLAQMTAVSYHLRAAGVGCSNSPVRKDSQWRRRTFKT